MLAWTQAHVVHMHAERTDTDTHAQSTDACRCSVAMVKLGAVRFTGKGSSRDSAQRQWQMGIGAVTGTGTDTGTGTGASTGSSTGRMRREQAGSSMNSHTARWQRQMLTGRDTGTGTGTQAHAQA